MIKFEKTTQDKYNSLQSIDSDRIYFITDTKKIVSDNTTYGTGYISADGKSSGDVAFSKYTLSDSLGIQGNGTGLSIKGFYLYDHNGELVTANSGGTLTGDYLPLSGGILSGDLFIEKDDKRIELTISDISEFTLRNDKFFSQLTVDKLTLNNGTPDEGTLTLTTNYFFMDKSLNKEMRRFFVDLEHDSTNGQIYIQYGDSRASYYVNTATLYMRATRTNNDETIYPYTSIAPVDIYTTDGKDTYMYLRPGLISASIFGSYNDKNIYSLNPLFSIGYSGMRIFSGYLKTMPSKDILDFNVTSSKFIYHSESDAKLELSSSSLDLDTTNNQIKMSKTDGIVFQQLDDENNITNKLIFDPTGALVTTRENFMENQELVTKKYIDDLIVTILNTPY